MAQNLLADVNNRLQVLDTRRSALTSEESLSNLISIIYEASLEPALWPEALRQLAADTPSVAAVISSHDTLARTSVFHQSFGLDPLYVEVYNEKWNVNNPIIDAVELLEPGEVSGLPALIDFAAFKRHPFYLEWGKPQGYNDAINIMLERTPTRFASVSLVRNHQQGLADTSTIERLRILAPHLLRAIRISRVLEHASVQQETLRKTIDALASPIFILHADGELAHANPSAFKIADEGLTVGRLVFAYKKCLANGMDPTARAPGFRQSLGERTFKVELANGEFFVCHASQLALEARRGNAPELTLVVVQNTSSVQSATKAVASLFGLTMRERDVLFGLVEVGGITATSTLLGLSKETVRTHVKALFLKTQTHRQSELVKLVTTWLTPFRPA